MVKVTKNIDTSTRIIGGLLITKVIREHTPIHESRDGDTFGTLLDAHIEECLENGEEIQSFSLELAEGQWQAMADAYHHAKTQKYSKLPFDTEL